MDESSIYITETFIGDGRWFSAHRQAKAWCIERGISMGAVQKGEPVGLIAGSARISKWRKMTAAERAEMDGTITGNFREGPLKLMIKQSALQRVGGAK